jgi:NAD(P)H-hydrate epimerase
MKNNGLITEEYVNTVIKRRKRDIHKGNCGKVLLIAGSFGMAGAAILCGWGALRSGAGLVRIAVPEELFTIIQASVPEATCIPRTSQNMDIQQYNAIAVGPGLGEDSSNAELIKKIFKSYDKTLVLDADALNQISRSNLFEHMKKSAGKIIITPHIGEAARLLQIPCLEAMQIGRQELAERLVQATNAIVVLKGEGTIVAMPNGDSYTNTTGNPGMATGGAGDVLTGIITAFAGQGLEPEDAAKAGVYIHGLAGDLGTETFGEYGLIAGDIARMSALAIKNIMG